MLKNYKLEFNDSKSGISVLYQESEHRGTIAYSILTGVVCCLLPFSFTGEGMFSYQIRVATCTVLVLGMLLGIVYSLKSVVLSITKNDVFVFLYLLYGSIRVYVSREELPLSLFSHWILLTTVYIISRNVNQSLLPLFFWMSGTIQAFLMFGQMLGFIESNHIIFKGTGCFWNPSQLGGFVACILPLVMSEFVLRKYPIWYVLYLLPMICALVLSDSRAAWIACGMGVFYLLPIKLKSRGRISIAIFIIVLIFICFYFYRPHSALGRLHVWRICGDMVQAKPWWGNGIHSFNSEYMLYQADYFHQYPDSVFADTATTITTPYNEFIHVLVEQGVVGFLLYCVLVGNFLFFSREESNKKYQAVILAFLLFSSFSYPGENIALLFVLVTCMGAVRGKALIRVRSFCSWKCVMLTVLFICIYLDGRIIKEYHYLEIQENFPLDSVCISRFKNEPEALQRLLQTGDTLNSFDRLKIQEWIARELPFPETYCELGYLYEQIKDYAMAEKYYQVAAYMIPNQIRANYFLFQLYKTTGKTKEALDMARYISRQKIKIENTFTLGVQGEIKSFLKNQDK